LRPPRPLPRTVTVVSPGQRSRPMDLDSPGHRRRRFAGIQHAAQQRLLCGK